MFSQACVKNYVHRGMCVSKHALGRRCVSVHALGGDACTGQRGGGVCPEGVCLRGCLPHSPIAQCMVKYTPSMHAGIHTPLPRHPVDRHPLPRWPPPCLPRQTPPPPGQTPPRHTPPGQMTPGGHCSGRYSSYWNAFLFTMLFCSLTPPTMLDTIKFIG